MVALRDPNTGRGRGAQLRFPPHITHFRENVAVCSSPVFGERSSPFAELRTEGSAAGPIRGCSNVEARLNVNSPNGYSCATGMVEHGRRRLHTGEDEEAILRVLRDYFQPDAVDRVNQQVTKILQKKTHGPHYGTLFTEIRPLAP